MKNTQYNAYLWPNRRNWKYSPLVHAPCIRL